MAGHASTYIRAGEANLWAMAALVTGAGIVETAIRVLRSPAASARAVPAVVERCSSQIRVWTRSRRRSGTPGSQGSGSRSDGSTAVIPGGSLSGQRVVDVGEPAPLTAQFTHD